MSLSTTMKYLTICLSFVMMALVAFVLDTPDQARAGGGRAVAQDGRPIEVADPVGIATAFRVSGSYQIRRGTYRGNFVISANDVTVDATGVRFEPEDRFTAGLTILGSRVRIKGLVVANGAPDRDTINVGANSITTVDALPHDVTLEEVTAEAGRDGGHRGFGLHGVNITLINCRATGFWERGRDSQAVWINNGPGPYTIEGGYFEGSGENIMVGGAMPGIADASGIPSDITIRKAHLFKPLSWKDKPGSVKNLFELKCGRRVLVEQCVLENNWRDGQAGSAILIKADAQGKPGDTPWMETSDVTLRDNVIKNSPDAYALNLRGVLPGWPSQRLRNVVIEHNLFTGITNGIQSGNGVDGLVVRRNTFLTVTGTFLAFYDTSRSADVENHGFRQQSSAGSAAQTSPVGQAVPRPGSGIVLQVKTPLTFVGNVLHSGLYGVKGEGTAAGLESLTKYAKVLEFSGNVIEQGPQPISYPPGNTILAPGSLLRLLQPLTFKYPGDAGY